MIKKLAIVFVVLLVIVVGAVFYIASNIDSIAQDALERGGTYALGVPTTVDSVSVSLMAGSLGVNGMQVANPAGFESDNLMDFDEFGVEVDTGSLFDPVVVVPLIEMDGLVVNIEKNAEGETNIDKITENIKKVTGEGKEPTEPAPGEPGKKVKVDKIKLTNLTAKVQAPLIGDLTVKVPELVLDNVSSDEGVPVSELVKRIWPAILAAIIEKGGGIIPTEMLADLRGNLTATVATLGEDAAKLAVGAIEDLGGNAGELVKGLPDALGKVIGGEGGVGEKLEGVGETVGETVKEGLGGLLGGDKKDGDEDKPDEEESDDPVKGAGDALKGLLGK